MINGSNRAASIVTLCLLQHHVIPRCAGSADLHQELLFANRCRRVMVSKGAQFVVLLELHLQSCGCFIHTRIPRTAQQTSMLASGHQQNLLVYGRVGTPVHRAAASGATYPCSKLATTPVQNSTFSNPSVCRSKMVEGPYSSIALSKAALTRLAAILSRGTTTIVLAASTASGVELLDSTLVPRTCAAR